MYILTFSLFNIQFVEGPSTSLQEDWELAKNKGGVKVYTRQPDGKTIKEFKAVMQIKTTIDQLVNLLENVEDYTDWQSSLSDSYTIKKLSSSERYIYYALDLPWPLSDRDVVTHFKKIKYKSEKVVFLLNSKPDYIKTKTDFVRIRDAQGSWSLTPLSNGYIQVVYRSYGDPAGNIPSSIVNSFIVDGPHETLLNMAAKCK